MGQIRLITLIFAGLMALVTLLVGAQGPSMHKQAMFTDEYHSFVEEDLPQGNVKFSTNDILPSKNISTSETQNAVQRKVIRKIVQVPEGEKVQSYTPQSVPKQVKQETVKVPVENIVKQEQVVKQNAEKNVQAPQRELTEQEEIIAWNRWRSNLQNQVMMDSKMYAPLGTVFKFSFTVDKYGNMSNIKVWSTNSTYTPTAVRVIKPVLSSYQHKAILTFPAGTKRVITNVNGGFVISTRTQYSTPADYSDYEKVKRSSN